MARETKAERQAREAEQQQNYEREFLSTYQIRLLNLVYDFSNKNPSVFSVDRNVETEFLFESSQSWEEEWTFPATLVEYDPNVDMNLQSAESAIVRYMAERAEEQRRAAVRAEARRKVNEMLTDEERELLGL